MLEVEATQATWGGKGCRGGVDSVGQGGKPEHTVVTMNTPNAIVQSVCVAPWMFKGNIVRADENRSSGKRMSP